MKNDASKSCSSIGGAAIHPANTPASGGDDSLMYEAGRITGHYSDPDGSPDVGYSVGLGGGKMLWIGEISEALFAETGAAGADLGGSGGAWFVLFGQNRGDTQVLGKAMPDLDHDALCTTIAAALAAQPPKADGGVVPAVGGWRADCFRNRMAEFDAAYRSACASSQPEEWMQAALLGRQFRNVAYAVLTGEAPKQEPPASCGWTLVPREPTNEMVQAGGQMLPPTERLTDCYDYFREAWTAALEARPLPPIDFLLPRPIALERDAIAKALYEHDTPEPRFLWPIQNQRMAANYRSRADAILKLLAAAPPLNTGPEVGGDGTEAYFPKDLKGVDLLGWIVGYYGSRIPRGLGDKLLELMYEWNDELKAPAPAEAGEDLAGLSARERAEARKFVTQEALTRAMRTFERFSTVLRYRAADGWHTNDIQGMREALSEFVARLTPAASRPVEQGDPVASDQKPYGYAYFSTWSGKDAFSFTPPPAEASRDVRPLFYHPAPAASRPAVGRFTLVADEGGAFLIHEGGQLFICADPATVQRQLAALGLPSVGNPRDDTRAAGDQAQATLHGRAWVAAEYRVTGSPHEWTDADSLAMARYILAGPRPPSPAPETRDDTRDGGVS